MPDRVAETAWLDSLFFLEDICYALVVVRDPDYLGIVFASRLAG